MTRRLLLLENIPEMQQSFTYCMMRSYQRPFKHGFFNLGRLASSSVWRKRSPYFRMPGPTFIRNISAMFTTYSPCILNTKCVLKLYLGRFVQYSCTVWSPIFKVFVLNAYWREHLVKYTFLASGQSSTPSVCGERSFGESALSLSGNQFQRRILDAF